MTDLAPETVAQLQRISANGGTPYIAPEPRTLAEVVATFERWLALPDPRALLASLGAVAANLLPGDPVWLQLVGPGGFGKSELLQALGRLPYAHPVGTVTEASLLSGTPQKERKKGARGGLLRDIGDFGVIVLKDFGSILSMSRDPRAATLAALREVYDGSWTRLVGSDGGQSLHWEGKLGLVAGCTPIIDRHHAVMSAMGERFLLFRLPRVDDAEQGLSALEHARHGPAMRAELSAAVAGLFGDDGRSLPREPRDLSDAERDDLIALATFVVHARAPVERDSYNREIELVIEAEAPGRLAIMLDRLLAGLDALGAERSAAWEVVAKVGHDCIPALRGRALDLLAGGAGEQSGDALAVELGHPSSTVRRVLQDLEAHSLVRHAGSSGKAHEWTLTDFGRVVFDGAAPAAKSFPEMSPPS